MRLLEVLHRLPDSPFFHTRALQACYSSPRPTGSAELLQQTEKELFTFRDPEPRFSQAVLFNVCLGNNFTSRLIRSAIHDGYCGYDGLRLDPALVGFRKSPEYPAILAEAKQCRDHFLAAKDQVQH